MRLSNVAPTDLQSVLDAIKQAIPEQAIEWIWRTYVAHYHRRTNVNDKTTLFDSDGSAPMFNFDHTQEEIKPNFDPKVSSSQDGG